MKESDDIFEDLNGEIDKEESGLIDEPEVETRSPLVIETNDDDIEVEIIDEPEEILNVDQDEAKLDKKPKKQKENYSARVRRRIDREKRITYNERQKNESLRTQLDQTNKELDRLRKSNIDGRIDNINDRITSTKEKLAQAIEAGETSNQVDHQDELAKLHATQVNAQHDKDRYQPEHRQNDQQLGEKTKDWLFNQSSWYNKDAEATKAANAIDSSLTSEGYDQNTDEYFEELNRRLSGRFPELINADFEEVEEAPKSKPVSARVEQIPASAKLAKLSSKVQLTQRDLANMAMFGLDTKDPATLKEYARNKLNRG